MKNLTQDQKDDLLYVLEDAQDFLFQAIEALEYYVRETGDVNAKAYIVDRLRIMASSDHGFCASDLNIDSLKERVR
jgi:hypothetical protein